MIHYQLRCEGGHEFEGWFRNSDAFEEQAQRGLLSCPLCGTTRVDRALMAPGIRTARSSAPPKEEKTAPSATQPVETDGKIPDVALALLQRLRHEVETTCENVGNGFADEALRIHRGEAEERGIYGDISEDQREMLEEEGVAVQRLPWVPRADG
ncbi:hypothetical protein AA0472_0872 [Acetobacter estunensis NRIC 0472]|uniref:DUF1178 family protein n=1 Tax=Acetobacter estunensis TaxID=104097 RepID=A0A967B5R8_9PROT|nr:DUF1178 family protein [Acetobacter estunensis]NHO52636.1 DUF1178 family protein [Acetobacter estunensis]GBQ22758.1 hypothetical protein AA0472_0872 [Acetobacter estunensis NRIC 0472]